MSGHRTARCLNHSINADEKAYFAGLDQWTAEHEPPAR